MNLKLNAIFSREAVWPREPQGQGVVQLLVVVRVHQDPDGGHAGPGEAPALGQAGQAAGGTGTGHSEKYHLIFGNV